MNDYGDLISRAIKLLIRIHQYEASGMPVAVVSENLLYSVFPNTEYVNFHPEDKCDLSTGKEVFNAIHYYAASQILIKGGLIEFEYRANPDGGDIKCIKLTLKGYRAIFEQNDTGKIIKLMFE